MVDYDKAIGKILEHYKKEKELHVFAIYRRETGEQIALINTEEFEVKDGWLVMETSQYPLSEIQVLEIPKPAQNVKYKVPFSFGFYGYLEVSVPAEDAKSQAQRILDCRKQAQQRLDRMSVQDMLARAQYLSDSAELDWDGPILSKTGVPVDE